MNVSRSCLSVYCGKNRDSVVGLVYRPFSARSVFEGEKKFSYY